MIAGVILYKYDYLLRAAKSSEILCVNIVSVLQLYLLLKSIQLYTVYLKPVKVNIQTHHWSEEKDLPCMFKLQSSLNFLQRFCKTEVPQV